MVDGKAIRTWWNDPVDYHWLVRMLDARSGLGPLKLLVGMGGATIALMGITIAGTSVGPPGYPGLFSLFGIIVGVLWTLRWWLLPWPGKNESLFLFYTADIVFTIEFLQVADPVFGAMGSVAFVVTGCYMSFFHSARALALHTLWTMFSVILFSIRIVWDGGEDAGRLGLAVWLLLFAAVVGALPSLQFLYWLLRTESLSDPLTELLNRRGLENQLSRLVHGHPAVCVMTFDLDRFKSVNDTWGHRVGDTVLIRTSRCLRDAAGEDAVVARTGGEEFVVAAALGAEAARAEAERLRRAIASTPESAVEVTASVGVAVFDPAVCPRCPRPTTDLLLQTADAAMYRAKQSGGNSVVVDVLTPPSDHDHRVPG